MTQVKLMNRLFFASMLFALTAGFSVAQPANAQGDASTVTITREKGRLRVDIGGKLFTEYRYENTSRPFLYPVIGPDGCPMTRNWPMKNGKNETHDHPHHKSIWFAHGNINGVDFWGEEPGAGRTVHEKFLSIQSGGKVGVIQSRNRLVANDGALVGTEDQTIRFHQEGKSKIIDFEATIYASHGKLTFGDTKEGMMAIRLAPTLRLQGKVGHGHIVTSEGIRDYKAWGSRADWVDYYGPVNGETVGVAIFDAPQNLRHPTWWHVRPYGLFAANPFGLHYFEKKPPHTGDYVLPAGKSITFRYRFYFHEGNTQQAKIAAHYRQYAAEVGNGADTK